MGKTAFSGPVYGAKSLLWSMQRDNTLTASSLASTIAAIRVPAYEDWYVTELKAYKGSTYSTAFVLQLTDDSTVIADVATTSSLAGVLMSTTPAADAGEYEGKRVAANSTLALVLADGGSTTAGSSNVAAWVYGYIRDIDSTRAV